MEAMDWGEVGDFVTLGSVGADDVDESTDVYILLAPQNIIGGCVLTNLGEMVRDAAEWLTTQIYINTFKTTTQDYTQDFTYTDSYKLVQVV